MPPIPQTNEAISFLQKWREGGPWVLTAISPTNNKIETATFHDTIEMERWIADRNGKFNLYFTINPVRQDMDSKPKRVDVSHIVAFQVDCDPRVGEEFESERTRILKSLQEFKPHPSVLVDSGGGYQAFWILAEPIELDGTEAMAMEYEAYSIQLELLLSGDRTSNCDRIFRLPGTINLPNEVKRKKGRVAALSSVVEWEGVRYLLSEFTRAPVKIQSPVAAGAEQLGGGGEKVQISGNLTPLYVNDLESRKIEIADHIKVLIIHGFNPDSPEKYQSRSEALWAVVCALARAGADDETIASIIMNKDNRISQSVLDKPRPERYAAKQIQDAREEVADPVLREFNSKHAVISDFGGKCRILSETFDPSLNRSKVSYQSFVDFQNRYCNRKIQVAMDKNDNPVMKPLGKWWIDHEKRRQYDTVVFAPGREAPNAYNLWQGFACEAIPGCCDLFLEHLLQNICSGIQEHYNYIIGWMARCVQQPDCPGEVALVLRGEMGTGKGVFARGFGSLFGRHFLQVSDSKHLVGSFNSHLRDCCCLFADEAFYAGDKKHESVLKALVTEAHLAIEQKGIDVVAASNFTHIIMASNASWVVPAGSNERRFFVLDVSNSKMQDKAYFARIQKELNSGGREALLYTLLHQDIVNFEVRNVPKTQALQDQKMLSMSADESWWHEKLVEGRLFREHTTWECDVQKNELQNDYINFLSRMGVLRKNSPTILGKFLGRVCPTVPKSYQKMAQVKENDGQGGEFLVTRKVYFYILPGIEECRKYWDSHHGGPFKWGVEQREMEMKPRPSAPEEAFK